MSGQEQSRMSSNNLPKDSPAGEGGGLITLELMKQLRRKANSESGSSSGENNSEDSALVSLGNTSFGFNFDSEEGSGNKSSPKKSAPPAYVGQNSEDDGNASSTGSSQQVTPPTVSSSSPTGASQRPVAPPLHHGGSFKSSVSSLTNTSTTGTNASTLQQSLTHSDAAANAVANLQSIVNATYAIHMAARAQQTTSSNVLEQQEKSKRKRKAEEGQLSDNETEGYNTDDDATNAFANPMMVGSTGSSGSVSDPANDSKRKKKKKKLDNGRREERNAREKERSFRISKQINELRGLLSNGGVIVPKGTKSSVLTEAANYIRMLQQHQYRSEIDRQQLVQQMQLIGGGAHGPDAALAIRHVAAQNGVWSLGNFGGVPPKSAMTLFSPAGGRTEEKKSVAEGLQHTSLDTPDYRFVFNSSGAGMAIASMGGAFLDCNQLFSQLSGYTKQELCSATIFNLTARQDLQKAFDQISHLISSPVDNSDDTPPPVVLRGSMKGRVDLGLTISLVRGEDGVVKCFCVTIVKNPASPFDDAQPVPASFESVLHRAASAGPSGSMSKGGSLSAAPAFTSG